MMQETFLNLPSEQMDEFANACYELGMMLELNPKRYKQFLTNKVKNPATPHSLKRLYKFMLKLNAPDREKFFRAFAS